MERRRSLKMSGSSRTPNFSLFLFPFLPLFSFPRGAREGNTQNLKADAEKQAPEDEFHILILRF